MSKSEDRPIEDMSVREIMDLGKKMMPPDRLAYMMARSETGSTYRRNRQVFQEIMLNQRVLHGHSNPIMEVEILGRKVGTPIFVAPVGNFWSFKEGGERDVTEGTGMAKSIHFISNQSQSSPEQFAEYAKKNETPLVWICYLHKGREEVLDTARRAERSGFIGVGIIADAVAYPKHGDHPPSFIRRPTEQTDRIMPTEKEIAALRKEVSIPLVIKGIMGVEDARIAVEAGADAIVLSNHGGRILDYCPSPLDVLPDVVNAVGNKVEIFVDGGIRRGTDALKALAMGAKGVGIGRPIVCGLAAGGSLGVSTVIKYISEELRRACILTGLDDVKKANPSILFKSRVRA